MKIFLAGSVSSASKEQLSKYDVYNKTILSTYPEATIVTPDDIYAYRNNCTVMHPTFENSPFIEYESLDDLKTELINALEKIMD